MKTNDLLDRFRLDVHDVSKPYLWADKEIYEYMDDAQKMFCRLTGGIADSTSAITQIDVKAGDIWFDVDPRILKLRYAARVSDYRPLDFINFEDIEVREKEMDYGLQRFFRLDNLQGPLQYLVNNLEPDQIRMVPIPSADDSITLSVYRLPLETIDTSGTQDLEIHSEHQIHLLKWMKHRAYTKQDAETFDRGKSNEFYSAFNAYCDQATVEKQRREHKYRAVRYGGI